jgi:hypothetical protein
LGGRGEDIVTPSTISHQKVFLGSLTSPSQKIEVDSPSSVGEPLLDGLWEEMSWPISSQRKCTGGVTQHLSHSHWKVLHST